MMKWNCPVHLTILKKWSHRKAKEGAIAYISPHYKSLLPGHSVRLPVKRNKKGIVCIGLMKLLDFSINSGFGFYFRKFNVGTGILYRIQEPSLTFYNSYRVQSCHGFLYYNRRTDFMPFTTLKIRPN